MRVTMGRVSSSTYVSLVSIILPMWHTQSLIYQ